MAGWTAEDRTEVEEGEEEEEVEEEEEEESGNLDEEEIKKMQSDEVCVDWPLCTLSAWPCATVRSLYSPFSSRAQQAWR